MILHRKDAAFYNFEVIYFLIRSSARYRLVKLACCGTCYLMFDFYRDTFIGFSSPFYAQIRSLIQSKYVFVQTSPIKSFFMTWRYEYLLVGLSDLNKNSAVGFSMLNYIGNNFSGYVLDCPLGRFLAIHF